MSSFFSHYNGAFVIVFPPRHYRHPEPCRQVVILIARLPAQRDYALQVAPVFLWGLVLQRKRARQQGIGKTLQVSLSGVSRLRAAELYSGFVILAHVA